LTSTKLEGNQPWETNYSGVEGRSRVERNLAEANWATTKQDVSLQAGGEGMSDFRFEIHPPKCLGTIPKYSKMLLPDVYKTPKWTLSLLEENMDTRVDPGGGVKFDTSYPL